MQRRIRLMNVLSIVVGLLLAACAAPATVVPKVSPSRLVAIEGSDIKQVVLTEKAVERLAIQTTLIREEAATRTRAVGGEVVQITSAGAAWVRVRLNESDLNQVDQSQSAFVRSLDDDDEEDEDDGEETEADEPPDGLDDDEVEDDGSGSGTLYYLVANADQTLFVGQRVWVEVTLVGGGAIRKIIPYAAVIYDVHGQTWVYTNPAPLTFVRQSISIDYIEDDFAFLTDGPSASTVVVTVGGAELYGTETGVSK